MSVCISLGGLSPTLSKKNMYCSGMLMNMEIQCSPGPLCLSVLKIMPILLILLLINESKRK